jgi:primosomal protein N' (replication factor Y) (superfamily II helicase)
MPGLPEARFARVVVDIPLPQPLDYRLGELSVVAGVTCVVPVGRRTQVGLIVDVADSTAVDASRLRDVAAVTENVDPLGSHWLEFTRFAADYYQHPWGEVALPALPPALRTRPGPRFSQSLTRLRARALPAGPLQDTPPRQLTGEQAHAVTALTGARGFAAFLLFGVTGSGKTEVYLRAIAERLRAEPESQALMLVPEINLTPQLEFLVRARFADWGVVTLHSGLADAERSAAWLAAHERRARIVIGTRLSVFASLPGLSIIVVDEEHDPSYKAGEGVRYSARDLSIKRAQMLGIPVVLGSATPSLESWAAAKAGRYSLLRLSQRAADEAAEPPVVELIDLRSAQDTKSAPAAIAVPVVNALRETLDRHEQSLVFLNRRGYAPVVACDACGWLSRCPQCSTFAVFHKTDRTLRCHHCGYSASVPRACPTCGNQALHGMGHGTQRIEETVQALLPGARVMRIDRDSTRRRHSAEQAFDAVHGGEVDILVGTQMVAKGHDFQRVTLVVVLNPDGQLASHDFRAPERLFSTLVQVTGRAGRGGHASRVLLQTRFPGHPLFAALARHDYAAFADSQLHERRSANMPPYTHQALLTAEARTMAGALAFLDAARAEAPGGDVVRVFDPVPRALQRVAGVDRAQLLVEADSRSELQAFLRTWLAALRARRSAVRWQIEVDPQEI